MVNLKIETADSEFLYSDIYVAVRVGEAQKLGRIKSERSYQFNQSNVGDYKYGKLEIFQKIGSCNIDMNPMSDCSQQLDVPIGVGTNYIRFNANVAEDAGAPVNKSRPHAKRPPSSASKAYLEQHNLELRLSEAMQGVLREEPKDPAAYIGQILMKNKGVVTKMPRTNPADDGAAAMQKAVSNDPRLPPPRLPTVPEMASTCESLAGDSDLPARANTNAAQRLRAHNLSQVSTCLDEALEVMEPLSQVPTSDEQIDARLRERNLSQVLTRLDEALEVMEPLKSADISLGEAIAPADISKLDTTLGETFGHVTIGETSLSSVFAEGAVRPAGVLASETIARGDGGAVSLVDAANSDDAAVAAEAMESVRLKAEQGLSDAVSSGRLNGLLQRSFCRDQCVEDVRKDTLRLKAKQDLSNAVSEGRLEELLQRAFCGGQPAGDSAASSCQAVASVKGPDTEACLVRIKRALLQATNSGELDTAITNLISRGPDDHPPTNMMQSVPGLGTEALLLKIKETLLEAGNSSKLDAALAKLMPSVAEPGTEEVLLALLKAGGHDKLDSTVDILKDGGSGNALPAGVQPLSSDGTEALLVQVKHALIQAADAGKLDTVVANLMPRIRDDESEQPPVASKLDTVNMEHVVASVAGLQAEEDVAEEPWEKDCISAAGEGAATPAETSAAGAYEEQSETQSRCASEDQSTTRTKELVVMETATKVETELAYQTHSADTAAPGETMMTSTETADEVIPTHEDVTVQLSAQEAPMASSDCVVVSLILEGIDYAALVADTVLLAAFKQSIKETLAKEAGGDTMPQHVQVNLAAGSVSVLAKISPPDMVVPETLKSTDATCNALSQSILASIMSLDGIGTVTKVPIVVSDISVWTSEMAKPDESEAVFEFSRTHVSAPVTTPPVSRPMSAVPNHVSRPQSAGSLPQVSEDAPGVSRGRSCQVSESAPSRSSLSPAGSLLQVAEDEAMWQDAGVSKQIDTPPVSRPVSATGTRHLSRPSSAGCLPLVAEEDAAQSKEIDTPARLRASVSRSISSVPRRFSRSVEDLDEPLSPATEAHPEEAAVAKPSTPNGSPPQQLQSAESVDMPRPITPSAAYPAPPNEVAPALPMQGLEARPPALSNVSSPVSKRVEPERVGPGNALMTPLESCSNASESNSLRLLADPKGPNTGRSTVRFEGPDTGRTSMRSEQEEVYSPSLRLSRKSLKKYTQTSGRRRSLSSISSSGSPMAELPMAPSKSETPLSLSHSGTPMAESTIDPISKTFDSTISPEAVQAWIGQLRENTSDDVMEEAALASLLVESVFKRPLGEAETVAVLEACPELFWLVECHCRTPLPPGWSRIQISSGDVPFYTCEATGAVTEPVVTETSPIFRYIQHLAETTVHVCYNPGLAEEAKSSVQAVVAALAASISDVKLTWTGPHVDPDTQETFYHCPSAGVSVYEDPSAWAVFLQGVAEQLLQHLLSSAGLAPACDESDEEP